ncbi:putative toxin-antitoxin system toxin component, PIN family [Azoarcus sp. PA01]|nr:putative toxin-antitoxin system toxin component, PIN family [Azoarcus sp. PA01]
MGPKKKLTPPRVVLDTNCVVSALLFSRGRLAWLRHAWQAGRFVPLVSRETVQELIRVLNYPKFKLEQADQEALLAEFLPYAETVSTSSPHTEPPALRDPDDVMFAVLAIEATADVLVSGDEDIQAARAQLNPLLVLTPAEFSAWLETRK